MIVIYNNLLIINVDIRVVVVRVMSANETVPILVNTSVVATATTAVESNEVALSITTTCCSDSSAEDVRLVPEVVFDSALDSPAVNRESQPLLGGLDVSYNQFPGKYYKCNKHKQYSVLD